ncbi:hypothetical protein EJ07DRAFT_153798 [Lizonia empirigonia]|nr:hypothetical protein EJ07DRAFT_153798 [Lizonia empirigonia]
MPVQALWRLQGLVFAAQAGTAMGGDAVESSVTLMAGVAGADLRGLREAAVLSLLVQTCCMLCTFATSLSPGEDCRSARRLLNPFFASANPVRTAGYDKASQGQSPQATPTPRRTSPSNSSRSRRSSFPTPRTHHVLSERLRSCGCPPLGQVPLGAECQHHCGLAGPRRDGGVRARRARPGGVPGGVEPARLLAVRAPGGVDGQRRVARWGARLPPVATPAATRRRTYPKAKTITRRSRREALTRPPDRLRAASQRLTIDLDPAGILSGGHRRTSAVPHYAVINTTAQAIVVIKHLHA